MNIESLTPTTSPPRANLAPQAARSDIVQLKKSEPKATEIRSQEVDNESTKLSVEEAVKRISEFVAPTQSEISFSVDDISGVQVVKIMDSQSNEVIRQFPSKEAIEIARALDKLQGLLIRDKA
jgi:flagellar protein FlaG